MVSSQPVVIAGGGIGGLSAAIALALKGVHCTVLEAEDKFSESGAGLQIGPSGSRILLGWGLGDALKHGAAQPGKVLIGDGLTGQSLTHIPFADIVEPRYGAPYFVAERRFLHSLLLDKAQELPEITLRTGFRVKNVEHNGDEVRAITADGEAVSGCVLIGADGVHSQVRRLIFGAKTQFSGRNAWRAIAPMKPGVPFHDCDVHLWMGPNAHLVHYACGPNGPVNAVAIVTDEAASPGWGTPGDSSALMKNYSGWSKAMRAFLEQFTGWQVWPLQSLAPLPHWNKGRVALLGDAAHPLLPFLASGAVMAIEDGAVLAEKLAGGGDVANALAAYSASRQPRAARVVTQSARMGEIYHMGGAMRIARNLTLAAMPSRALLSRNDWLYRYRATG